ncbi:HD domain-containing protein [Niveibacterium umoris]|uniref:Putative nucleotidyltransferase with HDIG domain n=1 Tax=Niveibacterium umoris TaxID=1193620 RepID=A0A840BLV5_9RHOO|nr:HD domain-containing phosphohydrolase [Niveibacterium umoris]MBB4011866.1 putative nucleotidyltransferase with HDIG domain [Niveibacterium umoris]
MTQDQFDAFIAAGKSLVVAIDERDTVTSRHLNRVATLAEYLALHCGTSETDARRARAAGQLHDIGKIAIPDAVLFKDGPLTHEEWSIMQSHSAIGQRILIASENPHLASIADIVRNHHEHFDGSGYPDGLAGDEIPLLARIVSLADAYDAMASPRPYRPLQAHTRIMSILSSEVGTKWDASLFDALTGVFDNNPWLAAPLA